MTKQRVVRKGKRKVIASERYGVYCVATGARSTLFPRTYRTESVALRVIANFRTILGSAFFMVHPLNQGEK